MNSKRRGGRAVERTSLENWNVRKGIEGSNPSLSAIIKETAVWQSL